MSILIVAGLMAFGLLAIIAAIFLAMNEDKTSPTSTTSPTTASSLVITPEPVTKPEPDSEQRLPAIKGKDQVSDISTQFSELTAQLHMLHEQAREIERRLSILSDIAEQIERGQSNVHIEETAEYRLLEPVHGVHTS